MATAKVFLSHNSADKTAVETLAHRLAEEGVEPWLDKWNLVPGEPWQEALEVAIASCDCCLVFFGPSGNGPWQNQEMRTAIARRVEDGTGVFRVIPVLLPGAERGEPSRLPQFLVTTTWVEFRRTLDDAGTFHRLLSGIRGLAPGPGPGQAVIQSDCPYRGLEIFDLQHAPFFFGRDAQTEWLLDKLRPKPDRHRNRFLAVVGASGSGKSSLVRAGLLAALKAGRLAGSAAWPLVVLKPGADPLENLAVALAKDALVGPRVDVGDLKEKLRAGADRLHLTLRVALPDQTVQPDVFAVIVVDQFEELFTQCRDRHVRQAFVDNLMVAATDALGRALVLLTLRADFYGDCAAYGALAAAISDHQVLVGPMRDTELRDAIVKPSQLAGCEFEPGLVELLLEDTRGQAGYLPLLQYALTQLWAKRDGRHLIHAGYQAIGGLAGALEQRASSVYEAMSDLEKAACQKVFLHLIEPGEGTADTRRRAPRQEFGQGRTTSDVLEELTNARLITVEGDIGGSQSLVQVAHEALINEWSLLRGWIETGRESMRIHQRLRDAANEWERKGHDKDYLYRGSRLTQVEEWMQGWDSPLSGLLQDFVRASIELRDAEKRKREQQRARELEQARLLLSEQTRSSRRLKTILGVVSVSLALVALLAWFAFGQQRAAKMGEVQAFEAARRADLARKAEAKARADAEAAQRIAEASERAAEENLRVAKKNLARAVAVEARISGALAAGERLEDVPSIARMGPQRRLLSALRAARTFWGDKTDNALRWSLGDIGGMPLSARSGSAWAMEVTPDGRTMVSGGVDQVIRIWDLHDPHAAPDLVYGHTDTIYALALGEDGRTLCSAGADDAILVWDLASPKAEPRRLYGHRDTVYSLKLTPDQQRLISSSGDGTIRIWNLQRSESEPGVIESGEVRALALSDDGRTLVSAGVRLLVWDIDNPDLAPVVLGDAEGVTSSVALSPDGTSVYTGGLDGTIRRWDTRGRSGSPHLLRGHTDTVQALALSRDGKRLYSASRDYTVGFWDLTQAQPKPRIYRGHDGDVLVLALTPDDSTLLTAGADNMIRVWDVDAPSAPEPIVLTGHAGAVTKLALSGDGMALLSAGEDKTVRLWDLGKPVERPRILYSYPEASGEDKLAGAVVRLAVSRDGRRALARSLEAIPGIAGDGQNREVSSVEKAVTDFMRSLGNPDDVLHAWDLNMPEIAPIPLAEQGSLGGDSLLSGDGRWLVTVTADNSIKLWDLDAKTSEPARTLPSASPHRALAVSNDGGILASAGMDQVLRVWDLDHRPDLPLIEHAYQVIDSLSLSGDGGALAVAEKTGAIELWDLAIPNKGPRVLEGGGQYYKGVSI